MEKPHYNFDYVGPAMTTVFILLTGEWVDAMEPLAALEGKIVSLFFIIIVLIGKYVATRQPALDRSHRPRS